MSNYQDPHPRTGALRAQIDGFIHRHPRALFHARLTIHDLQNVPQLGGDFAVKWKFRNLVPPRGSDKTRSKDVHRLHKGKAREASVDEHGASSSDPVLAGDTASVSSRPLSTSPAQSNLSLQTTSDVSSGPSASHLGSVSSHGPRSFSQPQTPSSPSTPLDPPSPTPTTPHRAASDGTPERIHFHSHERGMTQFVPIDEFTVRYEHTVNVLISMFVDPTNSTSSLLSKPDGAAKNKERPATPTTTTTTKTPTAGKLVPSPLKLVIYQKVYPNDVNAPENPRLGAVYIDLAEYADPELGPVTRKYLLMESKTNALLNLTIHLVLRNAPKEGFVAPPLRAQTIQAPLSSLLSLRSPVSIAHKHKLSASTSSASSANVHQRRAPNISIAKHSSEQTEAIIEAIFNPWPTHAGSAIHSPFTYQVDENGERVPYIPIPPNLSPSPTLALTPTSTPRNGRAGLASNGVPTHPPVDPPSLNASPPRPTSIRNGGSPLKNVRPPPIRVYSAESGNKNGNGDGNGSTKSRKSSLSQELKLKPFHAPNFDFSDDSAEDEDDTAVFYDALWHDDGDDNDGDGDNDNDNDNARSRDASEAESDYGAEFDEKGKGKERSMSPTPMPELPSDKPHVEQFIPPRAKLPLSSGGLRNRARKRSSKETRPNGPIRSESEGRVPTRERRWWTRLGHSRPGTPTAVS